MQRRVTLTDVARVAGVHPGTVSRALNEQTENQVSQSTARRVRKVAKELGYTPNTVARGLRTNRTMTIGIIVPDLTNPIFPPMVRGIDSFLAPRGYSSLVVNTDGSDATERTLFESLLERQVDGFIVATGHNNHELMIEAHARGIHAVMVNRDATGVPFPSVTGDDSQGVFDAVAHLHELGHKRMVHLAGPVGFSTSRVRADAFMAACKKFGINGHVVDTAAYGVDAGQKAMDEVLDKDSQGITAVVAGNDLLALGTYHSLRSHGLQCPEDVSVVGFNDMLFANDFQPPLTTVRSPHYEMGVEAARLLLNEIAGTLPGGAKVMLPVVLVIRGSTGAAKHR
ncbi:HTH-type transcriptional repressor CytR [mine drainage metagenome]|uniref:HTH-type transcriptional repressor CytR n=1 Tax=mine drainage metagenome TaxID=410659 RepID=A0A1J5QB10_9ZZZZ